MRPSLKIIYVSTGLLILWMPQPSRASTRPSATTETVVPVTSAAGAVHDLDTVNVSAKGVGSPPSSLLPGQAARVLRDQTGGAQAVAISNARISNLATTLKGLAKSSKTGARSVLSQLTTGFNRNPLPSFQLDPHLGSGAIKPLSGTPAIAAAIERASLLGGVRLSPTRLQLLPSSDTVATAAKTNVGFQSFARSYSGLVGALFDALSNPSRATTASLQFQVNATNEGFINGWQALMNDPKARSLAVRSLDAIREQPELKSVYFVQTSYTPGSYKTIFDNSHRLAVITDANGLTLCSGLSIAAGWVMTAGHCLQNDLPDLRIRVTDAQGQLSAPFQVSRQWPESQVGADPSDPIDYVFLQIAAAPADPLPALCLRSRDASYEEPLIAIGYAKGEELVYDAAYVWYPYSLLPKAFDKVAAMTMARLQRLAEADPEGTAAQEALFQREMQSFLAAYGAQPGSDPSRTRYYTKAAQGGATTRPRFGFDTDTSHGDSGAAVFSRTDNCIVGVFGGGRPDASTMQEASWLEHEFGTPISEILADIKKRRANMPVQPDTALSVLFTSIDIGTK